MKERNAFAPVTLDASQAAALSRLCREVLGLSLPPGKRAALDEALSLLWAPATGAPWPY